MTAKQLIVHIGHFKTGTTALQVFCASNSEILARNGIKYSEVHVNRSKHSRFAFAIFKACGVTSLMHGFDFDEPPEATWQRLFDEIRAGSVERTLISSEEFMRIGTFPQAAERLAQIFNTLGQGIDVRIVVYLRPVEAQVRSWYNQMVKMNQVIGDLDDAIADGSLEAIHYDYEAAMRPWIEIFGEKAVVIRRYPAPGAPRDALFDDFFEVLGIAPDFAGTTPAKDFNPRMDDRMLDAVRLAQNTGLPKVTAENLRDRVARFVEAQDALEKSAGGVELANERARAGLSALSQRTGMDLSDLGGDIAPRPAGPDLEALALQVGYLTKETVRLTRELNQVSARLKKERADTKPRGKGPFRRVVDWIGG